MVDEWHCKESVIFSLTVEYNEQGLVVVGVRQMILVHSWVGCVAFYFDFYYFSCCYKFTMVCLLFSLLQLLLIFGKIKKRIKAAKRLREVMQK